VGALETVEDQVKPELLLVAVVAAGLETCSMASSGIITRFQFILGASRQS
jgi:hypothetical protein